MSYIEISEEINCYTEILKVNELLQRDIKGKWIVSNNSFNFLPKVNELLLSIHLPLIYLYSTISRCKNLLHRDIKG